MLKYNRYTYGLNLGKCWAYNLRVIWMSHDRNLLDAAWKEIATSRRNVEAVIKDPRFHTGTTAVIHAN